MDAVCLVGLGVIVYWMSEYVMDWTVCYAVGMGLCQEEAMSCGSCCGVQIVWHRK